MPVYKVEVYRNVRQSGFVQVAALTAGLAEDEAIGLLYSGKFEVTDTEVREGQLISIEEIKS